MSQWPTRDVLFYNLHPPDEVRMYVTPRRSIKYRDASVMVFDVRIGEGILRKYSFTDRWFEVNCTFDLEGRLLPERGVVDWSFNCDMCTPVVIEDHSAYTVDLSLDILVAPDGITHAVTDEDDYARSVAAGLLTETEAAGAIEGRDDLLAIIGGTGLVPFLEAILPFDGVTDCEPQDAPTIEPVDRVPRLTLARRRVSPQGLRSREPAG